MLPTLTTLRITLSLPGLPLHVAWDLGPWDAISETTQGCMHITTPIIYNKHPFWSAWPVQSWMLSIPAIATVKNSENHVPLPSGLSAGADKWQVLLIAWNVYPKSMCWKLNPCNFRMWLHLEAGSLKRWLSKNEAIVVGPYPNWLLSLEEEEFWTQNETAGWLNGDIQRR